MSARLADDCLLAAKVMEDLGTFETGQGILREAAAELTRLRAQIEAADRLAKALSAAVEYMAFHSTAQCEPYPLDKCRAALSAYEAAKGEKP